MPAPHIPRPATTGRGAVSNRSSAIRVSHSASSSTTAYSWLWRLVLGSGLALAMVLGSELLPAAPPTSSSPAAATDSDHSEPSTSKTNAAPAAGGTLDAASDDAFAPTKQLRLTGKLFVDPNRLSRVHSRFAGQVVELGCVDQTAEGGEPRPLRFGDAVRRDQLLAVVWSREVGEKKSDLINALSRLSLDQTQFDRLSSLDKGVVPVHMVLDARRKCESDLIAVQRVQRTLRSWRLTQRELDEVAAEAEWIRQGDHVAEPLVAEHWAKFEIRSPLDGIILERNVTTGDLVGVGADMFKIGDLTTLGVMADLYEEDLPLVESLPSNQRQWTVYVASHGETAGIEGRFETIGSVIDPRQHTASVIGWVPNASGALRAGQLIRVEIASPGGAAVAAAPPSKSGPSKNAAFSTPDVQTAVSLNR